MTRFFRLADLGLLDGEAVVGLAVEPGLERILRKTVSDGGKAATWGVILGPNLGNRILPFAPSGLYRW